MALCAPHSLTGACGQPLFLLRPTAAGRILGGAGDGTLQAVELSRTVEPVPSINQSAHEVITLVLKLELTLVGDG